MVDGFLAVCHLLLLNRFLPPLRILQKTNYSEKNLEKYILIA